MKVISVFFKIVIVLILAIICSGLFYVFTVFPNAKLEEILFHIQSPIGYFTYDQITSIIINLCIPLIIIVLIVCYIWNFFKSYRLALLCLSLGTTLLVGYATERLELYQYIEDSVTDNTFIESHYIDPKSVSITFPPQKRNLIFLVLESMELTFADKKTGGYFSHSRIPHLTEIATEGESFAGDDKYNGSIPLFGTTWTMGATFGFTAGLPLKIGLIGANSMTTQNHFFENVSTLGDILDKQGYRNFVLQGSDMTFAGTELYFREHGNIKSLDYKYCTKNGLIPHDYYVWWGFEDQKLFDIAKQQILLEVSRGEPFSFIIYTSDTHMEDGYLSDFCPKIFDDKYSNVINCSSMQIGNFISWLKKQPFYENTTVVIVGDHLTMDSDYCSNIERDYKRKTFFSILNSNTIRENNVKRNYSTFDLFPTILASLGVKIEGNKLGLGTNLYSQVPTLLERYDEDIVNSNLAQKSLFMEYLAQIPKSKMFNDEIDIKNYISQLSEKEYKTFLELFECKDYLSCLKVIGDLAINEDFAIVFSARNGIGPLSSSSLNSIKNIYKELHNLNLKVDFEKHSQASYLALINGASVIEKYNDSESVDLQSDIKGHHFHVVSAGRGNYAYINIDGMEYSINGYGINFVIYDLKRDKVIASNFIPTHGTRTQ